MQGHTDTKPLIHCSPKIVKEEILLFLQLFKKAPLCNKGIGDLFWIYYALKKYKPNTIIENNIDGLSWLTEEVCPMSSIIYLYKDVNDMSYININLKNDYRESKFTDINWNQELGNYRCSNSLVICTSGDHREIVNHSYLNKIPFIIFTNNYPIQGNCLTVKKILSNNYHITQTNNVFDLHYIPKNYKKQVTDIYDYYEFPPIYLDKQITRWNDYFSQYKCKYPIFEKEEDFLCSFIKTQLEYTFICFLQLK